MELTHADKPGRHKIIFGGDKEGLKEASLFAHHGLRLSFKGARLALRSLIPDGEPITVNLSESRLMRTVKPMRKEAEWLGSQDQAESVYPSPEQPAGKLLEMVVQIVIHLSPHQEDIAA